MAAGGRRCTASSRASATCSGVMAANSWRFSASIWPPSSIKGAAPAAGSGGGGGTLAEPSAGAVSRCRCRPNANLESLRWVACGKEAAVAAALLGGCGAAASAVRSFTSPTMFFMAVCIADIKDSTSFRSPWCPSHSGPCSAHSFGSSSTGFRGGGGGGEAAGRRVTLVNFAAGLPSR